MLSAKLFLLLSCVLTAVLAEKRVIGGSYEVDVKEAQVTLEHSLSELAKGDGPFYKVQLVKKATRQLAAGTVLKLNADLIDGNNVKNCNVQIWTRVWLPNGVEVTFDCPGEEKVVKNHSA